jgi:uncharacterized protein YwqG
MFNDKTASRMESHDDIVKAAFAAVDRHIRRASMAEIGGFRPSTTPITSYFGGRFVGLPGEEWPLNGRLPMIPLLQVRTDELPYLHEALYDIALFNVFIGPDELPIDLPAENGEGWVLRSYSTLEGLVELPKPTENRVRVFPVRWFASETEGPQWEDAWDLHDLSEFNKLDDAINLFSDRYTQRYCTKVGGWPSYTQSPPGLDGYVFQIGSEEKPRWMWGDNGNGYFYRRDGTWSLFWDCY